jgi:polyhydroxyalkanoate synthase subunit PhaC
VNNRNPKQVDNFLNNAQMYPGSWWPHWEKWLRKYNAKKLPSGLRDTGQVSLAKAPGIYVETRCN